MSSPPTENLSDLFDRTRTGDIAARNELLTRLNDRIHRLVGYILGRRFQIVRRPLDSVVQDVNVKLIEALNAGLASTTADEFMRFVAFRVRQMLIDEAEKVRRRGWNFSLSDGSDDDHSLFDCFVGTDTFDPAVLATWTDFHNAVQALPEDERGVIEYHVLMGYTQAETAQLLGLAERQVSRLKLRATQRLADVLPDVR